MEAGNEGQDVVEDKVILLLNHQLLVPLLLAISLCFPYVVLFQSEDNFFQTRILAPVFFEKRATQLSSFCLEIIFQRPSYIKLHVIPISVSGVHEIPPPIILLSAHQHQVLVPPKMPSSHRVQINRQIFKLEQR